MQMYRGEASTERKSALHECMGEQLVLHPAACMYWASESLLIISDLHLGKTDHFRKHGVALPGNLIHNELDRIEQLIARFQPSEVLFLGDLFHSHYNTSWEAVVKFTNSRKDVLFTLVEGNHDIMEAGHYERARIVNYGIYVHKPPFVFAHDRIDDLPDGSFGVFGHIHPGVRLNGRGLQKVILPAFIFRKDHVLMPAFGTFTGLAKIYPTETDDVFAVADGKTIRIS